ncbi:MAG TPA: phosphoglycolate phosphatase [Usitatibacter sp.]|nr:phosphoglycolate phosphatase [Usitatibacter sp.]
MNSIRAVIFDLDGTLVDSAAEIAAALNAALFELQLPAVPREKVEAMIGRGVRVLVERALAHLGASHDVDDMVRRFEAHYATNVGTHAQLFAGVREGLERLHAAGYPMGVVTNKPRYFTERLLERLGVARFFRAIVAGDDGIRRKPQGDMLLEACRRMGSEPAASLMLGDSDNDVSAAREAGCPVWCVPYGYNEGREPHTLACDRIVPTVEELARHLLQEV